MFRTASIQAISDVVLWVLDRSAFQMITMRLGKSIRSLICKKHSPDLVTKFIRLGCIYECFFIDSSILHINDSKNESNFNQYYSVLFDYPKNCSFYSEFYKNNHIKFKEWNAMHNS